MDKSTSFRKNKGTVLVTVLMMFAIAAFLATEMAYRQKLDIRRTSAMLMTEQAKEYLVGAEELTKLALKDDFKSDQKTNKFVDDLKEEWAMKRPPFPVDGGYIQGEIVDLQSKFNINWLLDADGKRNTNAAGHFQSLLTRLNVPVEGSPNAVYEAVMDWMDEDQEPGGFDGKEDGDYLRLQNPYRTANRLVVDVSELKSVVGMDAETYAAIEPFLTALPIDTKLNLNTASAEVMSAVGLKVEDVLNKRASESFEGAEVKADEYRLDGGGTGGGTGGSTGGEDESGGKVMSRALTPGGAPLESGNNGNQGGVGQNGTGTLTYSGMSEYFELHAKAVIGGRSVYSRSILYRQQVTGSNSVKIEVIYRAFVDPLQQPMTPLTTTSNGSNT